MKKKTVMIMCAVFTMLTSIVSCSGKAQRSADTIPADTLQASLIIADSTCSDNFINSQDLVNCAVHVESQQMGGGTVEDIKEFQQEILKHEHKIEVLNKEIIFSVQDTKTQQLFQIESLYWKNFSVTYINYLSNIICLSHFGGSICSPYLLYMTNRLFMDRITEQIQVFNLLNNTHIYYHEKEGSNLLDIFRNKIKQAINYNPEIKEFYKECSSFPYMANLYDSTYLEAKRNYIRLQSQIVEWVKIRREIEHVLKDDTIQSNTYKNVTLNFIYKISQYPDSIK